MLTDDRSYKLVLIFLNRKLLEFKFNLIFYHDEFIIIVQFHCYQNNDAIYQKVIKWKYRNLNWNFFSCILIWIFSYLTSNGDNIVSFPSILSFSFSLVFVLCFSSCTRREGKIESTAAVACPMFFSTQWTLLPVVYVCVWQAR